MNASKHLKYEITHNEVAYAGFFQLKKYRFRHQRYDGEWTGEVQREVFERGDAVAVILLDPIQQKLIMVEQFRPGTLRHGAHPRLTELVAGMIEEGEKPADVVRRETEEETGCQVLRLRKICDYFVSPGGCSEKIELFLGEVDSQQALAIGGLDEEQEDIRVMAVPLAEAFSRLEAGDYNNAMSLVGLQWLKLQMVENKDLWPQDRLE